MAEVHPGTPERSDEDLAAAFRSGDEEAFNILVRRYKDPLLNFTFRYLGDYDEADDIVQETYIRFYRNPGAYRPVARFSTWLYTIASNLAKSALRRKRRKSFFSISRRSGGEQGESYDIPDSRYAADRIADSSMKEEAIRKALNELPLKYREVVLLCDIQELSYEEICSVTGLTMGTVKSRLNRARTRLQKSLKGLLDD